MQHCPHFCICEQPFNRRPVLDVAQDSGSELQTDFQNSDLAKLQERGRTNLSVQEHSATIGPWCKVFKGQNSSQLQTRQS